MAKSAKSKVIKPGKWNDTNESMDSLKRELYNYIDQKNLPKVIVKDVQSLIKKIDEFGHLKCDQFQELTGKALTKKQVQDICEDTTGYKWKIVKGNKNNSMFGEDIDEVLENIADTFGVKVSKKGLGWYVLDRNAQNRSELDTVEVLCLPGHVYVLWNTDRVSGGGESIMPNDKLKSYLKTS